MKICIISDSAYLHTQRWATFFKESGHQVSIIGDVSPSILLPGIDLVPLNAEEFWGPWFVKTTRALKGILQKIRPDILHVHYLGTLVAPVILRFSPLVVSVWGADIVGKTGLCNDPWRVRWQKKLVLRRADAVIALSHFLADATCKYAGLPKNRVQTLYWGIDLAQFSPRDQTTSDADAPVIGFVKHLLPKYGPEYLIRAFKRVQQYYPKAILLMVGDGPMLPALESLVVQLGLAENVSFVGYVEHRLVSQYMAKMDIFVMPSVYESESFGVAAVEAQAMGIPVVATKVGGVPEAVLDGKTGILVLPRDEGALAEAILLLLRRPDLRASMSAEGPRFVRSNYDWQKNAKRVEELYCQLLAQKVAL